MAGQRCFNEAFGNIDILPKVSKWQAKSFLSKTLTIEKGIMQLNLRGGNGKCWVSLVSKSLQGHGKVNIIYSLSLSLSLCLWQQFWKSCAGKVRKLLYFVLVD